MDQPELGRKIVELRKLKGLTQEELVERCKVSVRTIQRIECGEVRPRDYTVKTILAALDVDFEEINKRKNQENIGDKQSWFEKQFLIGEDINSVSPFVIKQLNIAWILGLVYFMVGIFEGAADYFRFGQNEMIFSTAVYVVIKLFVLVSFMYFMRGFVIIGALIQNYLLRIVAVIYLISQSLMVVYEIITACWPCGNEIVAMGGLFVLGSVGFLFGVVLIQLRSKLGDVARYAGICEIIASCFFFTLVLVFLGGISLMIAELLEIILLFKMAGLIQQKKGSSTPSVI